MDNKAYLASPWFNEKQKATMDKVRKIVLDSGIEVFAPYYDGIVLTKDNDSSEMRKKVFDIDIGSIINCSVVIAVIDDFDPGTIFECGYACRGKAVTRRVGSAYYGDMESIPIIFYSDVTGRGLNIMLQMAAWGFANGEQQLKEQLRRFINDEPSAEYLGFVKGDFV